MLVKEADEAIDQHLKLPEFDDTHFTENLCLRFLAARGIRIPPGQTLQYVIVERSHKEPARRYLPVPFLHLARDYDARTYQALLREALREVTVSIPGAGTIYGERENLRLW